MDKIVVKEALDEVPKQTRLFNRSSDLLGFIHQKVFRRVFKVPYRVKI